MSADFYLETARVRLRQLADRDVEDLVKLNSDPEVMRYLGGAPAPREEAEAGVARTRMYRERYGGRLGVFTAVLKETGAFMGWFHLRPDRKRLDDVKNLELGYRLRKEFWGKGYATEVSLALIAKAFGELGADTVFAVTDKENAASRRVMEKCGLAFESEFQDADWDRLTVRYAVDKKDALNPLHLEAHFAAELPPSGLPRRFGIVTAYNPGSRNASAEANARADAELAARLERERLEHFRVTGRSRDGSHQEPGYGIVAASPEDIRPLSRRFRQEAFFWVEDGTVFVINTEGASRRRVAAWADRRV